MLSGLKFRGGKLGALEGQGLTARRHQSGDACHQLMTVYVDCERVPFEQSRPGTLPTNPRLVESPEAVFLEIAGPHCEEVRDAAAEVDVIFGYAAVL